MDSTTGMSRGSPHTSSSQSIIQPLLHRDQERSQVERSKENQALDVAELPALVKLADEAEGPASPVSTASATSVESSKADVGYVVRHHIY
jgi:hypothetical protein